MPAPISPLLTDLYQLNMLQAYLDEGHSGSAVFEFFMRNLPARRRFLVAAGLEQLLDYLERLRFSANEIEWLGRTGRFKQNLLDYLAELRFTGDVHAIPEGTVFFADEPLVRVTAPLPQAQLIETRLINLLHFQTLVASKAARMVLAAPGKLMVDFGLRRAHGAEAGLFAARASYIAGFAGTATVLADNLFGIPIYGTMAHSFIQSFDDEMEAFEAFARSRPENLTLLIDSYDTEACAHKVVALAPRLRARGISIRAVRLDSGDLIALSKSVRRILDDGGLREVRIFASGGLTEDSVAEFLRAGAPIDGFGMGTSLTTSSDVASLDCVYKLQEYAGLSRRKRSTGKATWPGRKQVWRSYATDERMVADVLSVENDEHNGEPLIALVMQGGRRVTASPSLAAVRERAARDLARLPEPLRRLDPDADYPVQIGARLLRLADEVDIRLSGQQRPR
jgi:nicotinate phosphoribosyltransferase